MRNCQNKKQNSDLAAEPVSLEGIANDPIIPVPPTVALLFGKSNLAFGVDEGLALAATTYSDTIQVNKTALRNLGVQNL